MQSNQYVNERHLDIAPDFYNRDDLKGEIPESFVISRKTNGDVKSLYSDNVWDYTAYSAYSCKFTFQNSGRHTLFPKSTRLDLMTSLTKEMKLITFHLMNAPEIRNMQSRGLRTKF